MSRHIITPPQYNHRNLFLNLYIHYNKKVIIYMQNKKIAKTMLAEVC